MSQLWSFDGDSNGATGGSTLRTCDGGSGGSSGSADCLSEHEDGKQHDDDDEANKSNAHSAQTSPSATSQRQRRRMDLPLVARREEGREFRDRPLRIQAGAPAAPARRVPRVWSFRLGSYRSRTRYSITHARSRTCKAHRPAPFLMRGRGDVGIFALKSGRCSQSTPARPCHSPPPDRGVFMTGAHVGSQRG